MRARIRWLVVTALCGVWVGCGSTGGTVNQEPDAPVTADVADVAGRVDAVEILTPDATDAFDLARPDDVGTDALFVECEPGQGCFLDPCKTNGDCLSGWCVEHLGDGVCSQTCQEDCPPGWQCKAVGAGGPDLTYVCVSNFSNLCKPCTTSEGCQSMSGVQDACLDYGPDGSFCGGNCATDEDCPWGFSCDDVDSVDGVALTQCVADSGVCPCSARAVELGLTTPCEHTNEFGTCTGKRVCTADGLAACDAAVAAPETCNGLDDNCDGAPDNDIDAGLAGPELCDDDNPCTLDTCDGEAGCLHESLDEGECLDGDACTVGDHCEAGTCVGLPIACDDDDPCTDDLCDGLGGCTTQFNTAPCDDGDPCTVNDTCQQGECTGFDVNCACQTDADCAALDDGNACNGTLFCDTATLPYTCKTVPDSAVTCELPPEADPHCQAAACIPETGACEILAANDGFACDDDNACTVGEHCQGGTCTGGVAPGCNDGNPCTDDACDPATGCVHSPNTAPCFDGDVCTQGDSCADGACVPGPDLLACDDANPCTQDSCDPGQGCVHAPLTGTPCDDSNACTTGDTCDDGTCQWTGELTCDDDNPCTTDTCTAAGGCVHTLNSAPCDDGDLCTTGDHCHLGACISAGNLACDDGNPCTADTCKPLSGCAFAPAAGPCDDANACTLDEACSQGWCVPAGWLDCDDSNPCTDDACDPAAGCVHPPNAAACDDGDACTTGDACVDGACVPGPVTVCDDANVCTNDSCDPGAGCIHTPAGGPCQDGDACTVGDLCVAGGCKAGAPMVCNDQNACTDDSCDAQLGCVYAANTLPCDDGDSCTLDDVCTLGECVGGPATDCDDSNPCTADECDSQGGCLHTPAENGTECGQDLVCYDGDCVNCGALSGSETFEYTGDAQVFQVPPCITQVTMEVWGAQGGNNPANIGVGTGGKGGFATGTLAVTPGELLHVFVGGQGNTNGSGGYNHGGNGGAKGSTGGGGASDVRRGGLQFPDRVIVGAGGGGAAYESAWGGNWGENYGACSGGDGGGLTGEQGHYWQNACQGGTGGTQTTGGDWAGSFGVGGPAKPGDGDTAGGGAGWYGGGGGGSCTGHNGCGGGGSSYIGGVANGATAPGQRTGHGRVIISW